MSNTNTNSDESTAAVKGIPDDVRRMVEHAASLKVEVKVHPGIGLVEVQTREKFGLRPHVTYLSYDTFEAVYCGILQMKLAAKGTNFALEKSPH